MKWKSSRHARVSCSLIISFNAPAFCSHGAEQNENAPMSKREAYEYTTALNTLLADRDRVQRIGDDTVISWAHCGNGVYPDLFSQWQNGSMGQSAVKLDEKTVKDATHALAQGRPYDYEGIHLSPDEKFPSPASQSPRRQMPPTRTTPWATNSSFPMACIA